MSKPLTPGEMNQHYPAIGDDEEEGPPVCTFDGKPAAYELGEARRPACASCAQQAADFHAEHGDTNYRIHKI